MMKFLHFYFVVCVVLVCLMSSGCGSSGASLEGNNGGGGGTTPPTTGPTAKNNYVVLQVLTGSNPQYSIQRYSAGATGNVSPNLTIPMPANFVIVSVKTDPAGNLYVSGGYNTAPYVLEILVYPEGGSAPSRTLTVSDSGPLAIDNSGNIYMVGRILPMVYVYSSTVNGTATPTRSFAVNGVNSLSVEDAAIDGSNNLYVGGANATATASQVLEFNATSAGPASPTRTINLMGYSPGVAVDNSGNLYVSNNISVGGGEYSGTIYQYGTTSTTATKALSIVSASVVQMAGLGVDTNGYIYTLSYTGNGTVGTFNLNEIAPTQNGIITPAAQATLPALSTTQQYESQFASQ